MKTTIAVIPTEQDKCALSLAISRRHLERAQEAIAEIHSILKGKS